MFLVRALILGALFAHMRCGTQSVNKIIRLINVEGQRVAFKIRTTARNMFSTTPSGEETCGWMADEAGEKKFGSVHRATRCLCRTCKFCYICQDY